MAKDAYYFSHDYDPLGDPKMQAMVSEYGGLGYGIFWRIVEMLHSDSNHRLPLKKYVYSAVASQMKVETAFVEDLILDCLNKFELFIEANEAPLQANEATLKQTFFASNRVLANIENKHGKKSVKSDSGRLGGIKSGESRRNKKEVEANEANRSDASSNEAKERKGKESIEIQRQTQLCPEMVKVFKKVYPKYPSDQEADYPACLQIAYKIADSKGWQQESVLNGNLVEVLKIWQFMVDFSKADTWFSTRAISDFNKEYQRLVQKITNQKAEKKETKPQAEAPPLKRIG